MFPLNPGTIEELHKRCQGVFPMFFEGAKLLVNKGLSNNFQVSHTLTLSAMQPSGYRFGATYVGSKMLGPTEAYPLLLADVDLSGNLNANVVHAISDRLRGKMIAQIQDGKWQSTQMTADYKGDLYTASLTLGNPDLVHGTGVAVLHFLRAVSRTISLGAELAYQANPQLPGRHIGVVSLAARYADDDCVLSATLGNSGGLHTTFYQKCSQNLQVRHCVNPFWFMLFMLTLDRRGAGDQLQNAGFISVNRLRGGHCQGKLLGAGLRGFQHGSQGRRGEEAAASALHDGPLQPHQPPKVLLSAGHGPHHRLAGSLLALV